MQPTSRRELLHAAACAAALLWINAYICRDLFSASTAYMNSMHGFWIALAKMGSGGWLHPTWWPYWDCGIPFEFTYAPLVPAMAAAWAAIRGVPHSVRFPLRHGLLLLPWPAHSVPDGLAADARARL